MVQRMQANSGIGAPVRTRHIAVFAALMLAGAILGGCSSINDRIGPAIGDNLPQWAGGLPKDVPPRKGTPEYDAYMQEQERKRLEPAPSNANASAPTSSSPTPLNPAH
jgi:hypothetical protein